MKYSDGTMDLYSDGTPVDDDHERRLDEEFERNGKCYVSAHGRYVVRQQPYNEYVSGSAGTLMVYGTALAKENWVYTGPPLWLSEAMRLADKWDAEDEGKLIATTEAAERLQVSVRRVQQLIERKELFAVPSGRDWLINPADLQNLPPPQKRGPKPKLK